MTAALCPVRGRRELFDEGRHWLEANTGIPVLGVMPWLGELSPPEDSLDLLERRGRKRGTELKITVLKLPSLSNFSDLDPLEDEPTVPASKSGELTVELATDPYWS